MLTTTPIYRMNYNTELQSNESDFAKTPPPVMLKLVMFTWIGLLTF